jgi:hypothetical protein
MVNLESDIRDNRVKLKEQSSRRKDRYSSVSYANYFAKTLERNIAKQDGMQDIESFFKFRTPANIIGGR